MPPAPGLTLDDVALFRHVSTLRGKLPWACMGQWPTPVERLPALAGDTGGPAGPPIYVKREDLSSPPYGGNKIRTLEPVLGHALDMGATTVWATGAYGSNHALGTALHARTLGLQPGAALFPQPQSPPARANLSALLSTRPRLMALCTVAELPLAMLRLRRQPGAFVMSPGAASPLGALGALSAALELAEQVAAGVCPAPARIVLAVGSTCTTAGLLAGLHLAAHLGIAFGSGVPAITAVRVTPWPITSPTRIAHLAYRTVRNLARLAGVSIPVGFGRLRSSLTVDGRYMGGGYGRASAAGCRARHAFRQAGGPPLDVVYSAKSGAALLDHVRGQAHGFARERSDGGAFGLVPELVRRLIRQPAAENTRGPLLFWATKSSAPLPGATPEDLALAPRPMRKWLDRARSRPCDAQASVEIAW
jgi:D-cysteine desulfhydrase